MLTAVLCGVAAVVVAFTIKKFVFSGPAAAELNIQNVGTLVVKDFNDDIDLKSTRHLLKMAGVSVSEDIETQLRRIGNMNEECTLHFNKTLIITPVPNTTRMVITIEEE